MATPSSVLVSWPAAAGTPPIFYITNHRVNGDQDWIPNPLGETLATSEPITGLAGATTYNFRVQARNDAGTVFSDVVNFTTPFGATVVLDTSVSVEWGSRVQVILDAVVPAEFGSLTVISPSATRTIGVGVEWGGGKATTTDAIIGVDIINTPLGVPLQVQGLQLTGPTNTTLNASWLDNATGPLPTGYQVQWRPAGSNQAFLNIIPTVPEPAHAIVVSQQFVVPAEFRGNATVIRDDGVAAEWRGPNGASRDLLVSIEFGGNKIMSRDSVVPVEFSGTTRNVIRDVTGSDTAFAAQRRDATVGIEWRLTPTPAPTPTFTEIDLGMPGTVTDSVGTVWGLTQVGFGGEATVNGAANTDSSPCDILVYVFATQLIWIRDQSNPSNWYYWTYDASGQNGGFWTGISPDPR